MGTIMTVAQPRNDSGPNPPGVRIAQVQTPPVLDYRNTSLIRNSAPLGPYSRTPHGALWWP